MGAATSAPDRGFPLGGLCGWVGYDGGFVFGDYPEMLVWDHRSTRWHQTGALAAERFLSSPEWVRRITRL